MIPEPVATQNRKLANLSLLPNSTSSFNPIHRRTLNIVFENATDADQILEKQVAKFDENLLIRNMIRNDLRTIDEKFDLLEKLNDEEKSIAILLNKVILHDPLKISIRESFTNNFVSYLLNKMEFGDYPLVLNLQPKYSFEVEGSKISGKPEFSVEKDNQVRIIFMDESRHLNNIRLATEFSECQIAAELLACAFTNYAFPLSASILQDQTIFAVRIIGTKFTFYKCLVLKNYMDCMSEGTLNESTTVTIYRFPPSDDRETLFGYDFSNPNHRKIILTLLSQLREQVKHS